MRKVLAIAATSVRRLVRDRSSLFFVFLMPVILILVIGVVFGSGFTPRVGVVVAGDAGALADEVVSALEANSEIDVSRYETEQTVRDDLRRGNLEAAVVLPPGYDASLRSGEQVDVGYLSTPSSGGLEIQSVVLAPIVDQAGRVRAARFAADRNDISFEEAQQLVTAATPFVTSVSVEVEGAATNTSVGSFDLGAAQNLVLWVFITSLAGSAALIQSRKLGVSRRMLSTPTPPSIVIAGEGLGRFGVAMLQGVFIVGIAAIVFAVNWGNPIGAGALVIALSLVGAGAGMLVGSTFSNDEQAGGIGIFLALGMGALGGCMVPLEVFSPTMRTIAHITPHAWALDAFSALIRDDAGPGDILRELGVLGLYGVGLLGVAAVAFRRSLTA